MAGWTIVATTLGASAITGAVGYWSAWLQSRVGLEQARVELERLRIQHREDHLRNRQTTYHLFLDATTDAERLREGTRAIFDATPLDDSALRRLDEQQTTFRHLLNGVRLFGTANVRTAADTVDAAYVSFTVEWWTRIRTARQQGLDVKQADVLPMEQMETVQDAIVQLVDAMRADVAPD